ncbi:phosphatase tensin type domain-containing protein [Tieghemostelium lacteum]|uniref:Phosphatase tensin type domain-containing protein n=1 Tax=Tieghemostelium lacteum TaxID=361077 RepID=A0A151ZHT4_TIELA|nr:phosphatase tensin type domain-containing protein [Tieghemostelium lacteum]|eukprot:KYQ93475.1 phosphatase tensin type domain-containing protein [Tieghemostelium lacteum]
MSESGFDLLRTLVSGKKKRFVQDNYNLDLSYITEKLIAMAYPAESSLHKVFRNDINEIYSFFEKYHSQHWRIINVAMEISYSNTRMGGNVYSLGFEDHTPPPFLLLLKIIDTLHEWLVMDPKNVCAVHCKAGKGRTGTIITCYLIYLLKLNCPELFQTSPTILGDMLGFFNKMRADNQECVTVPSQKRYCGYYIQFLKNEIDYSKIIQPVELKLLNIEFLGTFNVNINSISIYTNYNPLIKDLPIVLHRNSNSTGFGGYNRFESNSREIRLRGDTLIKVYASDSQSCAFRFVFHTSFVTLSIGEDVGYPTLTLQKAILDGGNAGALNDHRFKQDFQVRVNMESIDQYQPPPLLPPPPIPLISTDNTIPLLTQPPPVPDRSKKPLILSD